MFQLLIVDDESAVVEGLSHTIPWEEVGIDHVHTAYSGSEAMTLLNKNTIDIVITDVRMPGMNGIELVKNIRRKWKKTKCILLSGYAEFEYAQQAVKGGAFAYLLKPVRDEEMIETVNEAIDTLNKEWEAISSYEQAVRLFNENLPILRQNLLKGLLQGQRLSTQELTNKLMMYDISLSIDDSFVSMLIRIEDGFESFGSQKSSVLEYAIGNIANEIFNDYFNLWYCRDDHDFLVFLVKVAARRKAEEPLVGDWKSRHQLIEQMATQLQKKVRAFLKAGITVLISDWGVFPNDLTKLNQSLVSSLRNRIGKEQEFFMTVPEEGETKDIQFLETLHEPPALIHLVEAGRWEEAFEKLSNIFEELNQDSYYLREHVLAVVSMITNCLTYIAHKNGGLLEGIIGDQFQKLSNPTAFHSVKELEDWTFWAFNKMKQDTLSNMQGTRAIIVQHVQKFVEAHLDEDVSLQAIADHVRLHPVYVSKVYKTETGESLRDYLHQLRMKKAIYLLGNSHDKIYHIARNLGYQNTSYFIKVFKKHYGLTPQEYRNNQSR